MTTTIQRLLDAGTIEEVRARRCTVVTGGGHAIAVFPLGDRFAAVDNRCPHMGFPLDRGTVSNGILTCHWHHARFDLSSGGTFDPFADDVGAFPVSVSEGRVWVDPSPPTSDPVERWSRRLEDGMEHNIRLVIAKSVLGLNSSPAGYRTPLTIGAKFGTTYSDSGWGAAMTMMTCSANILAHLYPEDRPLALYQGIRQVAAECAGRPPRFPVDPLPTGETRPEVFKEWFRGFIEVRDVEGAERCLRTAVDLGISPREIADMVFAAATDRVYLDGGHVLDFCNKAFELLDHIGWEHAGQVLTSLVRGIAMARRSEELNSWRNPIDLSSLVWEARNALPDLWRQGAESRGRWDGERPLVDTMLSDDPAATLEELQSGGPGGRDCRAAGRCGRLRCIPEDGPLPHLQRVRGLGHRPQHPHRRQRTAPGAEARPFGRAIARRVRYGDQHLPRPLPEHAAPAYARVERCTALGRPRDEAYWRRWTRSSRWNRRPAS